MTDPTPDLATIARTAAKAALDAIVEMIPEAPAPPPPAPEPEPVLYYGVRMTPAAVRDRRAARLYGVTVFAGKETDDLVEFLVLATDREDAAGYYVQTLRGPRALAQHELIVRTASHARWAGPERVLVNGLTRTTVTP